VYVEVRLLHGAYSLKEGSFMKIRIGNYSEKYWVEGFYKLRWRKLPRIHDWLTFRCSREDPLRVAVFNSFEAAKALADEYMVHEGDDRNFVYTTPK
jgi:hypothetical protein